MSQTVLITGANRGIGLALTQELLRQGHRVFAGARQPENAAALQELAQSAASLTILELDVNAEESVAQAVTAVGAEKLDVLVNNAAVFPEEGDESLLAFDLQHFRDAFETNVIGVVRVTRQFLPLLEKSANPRVVNISSGAGSISQKDDYGYYAYSASKAALNMVTRAMAAEFPKVCIIALSPGWVKTDMGGPNAPLTPEQSARAIAKTIDHLTLAESSKFLERSGQVSKAAW